MLLYVIWPFETNIRIFDSIREFVQNKPNIFEGSYIGSALRIIEVSHTCIYGQIECRAHSLYLNFLRKQTTKYLVNLLPIFQGTRQ